MKSRAIVFTGVSAVETRTLDLPDPGPGEVALEAQFSAISPGTELRVLAGRQDGAQFPCVPGYAMAAKVVGRGAGVTLPLGSLVFSMGSEHCGDLHRSWGGHMSHAVCSAASVLPIPEGVDLAEAAASKLASIPYHGLRLCRPLPEEKIAVIGLGAIGLMAATLYSKAGCHVAACDRMETRVAHARKEGLLAAVAKDDLKGTFSPFFPGGADVVVDCSGVPAILPNAMEILRELPWGNHETRGPRYIVQGSYADSVRVPYNPAFLREISMQFPRSEQDRDRSIVFDMLKRGALSLRSVISDIRSPETAAKTYAELGAPGTNLLSVVFDWKKEPPRCS